MPVPLSYPGVYIEEIPSGVRTITGVATSIAAFVGWAPKGPVDHAALVLSWSDYVRQFGGLDTRSLLGYAVNQFFANGGQRAYIVRLVRTTPPPPAGAPPPAAGAPPPPKDAATATVTIDQLTFHARNPGQWASGYAIATKVALNDSTRFQVSVVKVQFGEAGADKDKVVAPIVTVESFENLSIDPSDKRYVYNVIEAESDYITGYADQNTPPTAPAGQPAGKAVSVGDAMAGVALLKNGEDGTPLQPGDNSFATALDLANAANGVYLLDRIDLFNLLCVPGETDPATLASLQKFCRDRRAFLIADCAQQAKLDDFSTSGPNGAITGGDAINAAFYFPWLIAPDPLQENRPREFPPCGFVAGIYARTDSQRGVWKAPAGSEASLTGVIDTKVHLTDHENGVLNPLAVNCIRNFPTYGTVVWGSRTLQGNDERGSEWKYIPVRRMALFIEETLYRATKWVVFEPNDEPLWAQIRLNIGAFMHDLFRQGAFQGTTPKDAYFVKCDKETTTLSDINKGIVNILVGFAPLKPAEFVVIQLQQIAGDIQT
jgi:phage tail sheath protein FI